MSVQVGDIFDRGDNDLPIQEWVYRLARDAGRANGAVYSIMGNHEVRRAGQMGGTGGRGRRGARGHLVGAWQSQDTTSHRHTRRHART